MIEINIEGLIGEGPLCSSVMRHPKLGQEYVPELEDAPPDVWNQLSGMTLVPIEYDDTGNLVVDQYPKDGNNSRTVAWNEEAFQEYVREGYLEENRSA